MRWVRPKPGRVTLGYSLVSLVATTPTPTPAQVPGAASPDPPPLALSPGWLYFPRSLRALQEPLLQYQPPPYSLRRLTCTGVGSKIP